MFAPPFSAAVGAGPAAAMPGSPAPDYSHPALPPPRHGRQRSQSWDPTAGLPPRPHEIDANPTWQHAMIERPQAMNVISKHPKVKLDVFLNAGHFAAGSAVTGSIQVTSATSNGLRLGDIAVELEAFEELTSRDHSATQTFLYNRTLFQGHHLPPSNAVLPTAPQQGYWTARKGRTTFPFSFRLPATAPSSTTFAGNAAVKYVIKATVQAWYQDSRTVVSTRADAVVVEQWHDEHDERYAQPLERIAETRLFMGGHGSVWLEAAVPRQLFVAGSKAFLHAAVRNASKRDVSGLRIDVVRTLSAGPDDGGESAAPTISQIVHTQHFKGQPFDFAAGCEQVLDHLAIDLPSDTRTIRKTRLFTVGIALVLSLQMGTFAKDLQIKIPVYVAHPDSARGDAMGQYNQVHQHHAALRQQLSTGAWGDGVAPGVARAVSPQMPRSQSAMGQHGNYIASMSPSPDMRSQSAMGQHGMHVASVPMSPGPVSPHSRPHSAMGQHGNYIASMSPSPDMRSQSAMGQHGNYNASVPMSPGPMPPGPRSHSAMGQHPHPHPYVAPYASHDAPHAQQQQQPPPPPQRPHSAAPPPQSHTTPAMISLPSTPLPFAHPTHGQAPQQQVSWDASNNAWNASRFQPQPPQQQQQQQHQQQPPNTLAFPTSPTTTAVASVLAPSPEARPIVDNTAAAAASPPAPQHQPLGLSTIEEDSESRANTITVKSLRAMGGDRTGVRRSVSPSDVELFEHLVKQDGGEGGVDGADSTTAATGRAGARDVFAPKKDHADVNDGRDERGRERAERATHPSSSQPSAVEARDTGPAKASTQLKDTTPTPATNAASAKSTTPIEAQKAVPPPPSTRDDKSTIGAPPAAAVASSPRVQALPTPAIASPARPTSAQGRGLTALEQRLGSATTSRESSPAPATMANAKPSPAKSPSKSSSSSSSALKTSTSALRLRAASAAAEERQREQREREREREREQQREQERENERKRERERQETASQEINAAARTAAKPMPPPPNSSSARTPASPLAKTSALASSSSASPSQPSRKVVDPAEARQLGKEAVGRVGGWLEQAATTTPPASKQQQQQQQQHSSPAAPSTLTPADTPKTPSASAILSRSDSNASVSTVSPSAALGGGTLRAAQSHSHHQAYSGAALARSESSSKDIQALASAFGGVKASSGGGGGGGGGTSNSNSGAHNAHTTSKTLYRDIEADQGTAGAARSRTHSQPSLASSPTRNVIAPTAGITRKLTSKFETQEQNPPTTTTTTSSSTPSEYDNATRHDVRSVRGGRGGRVASAASLWASIANGTDGKLPVPSLSSNDANTPTDSSSSSTMRRTMVNARPQARRSMNGEAPALDFTDRGQVEAAIRQRERDEQQAREAAAPAAAPAAATQNRLPSHAAPKAVRPPKKASSAKPAIAIPSAFGGHPSNAGNTSGDGSASSDNSSAPKITRRAAPPFLNTTTPKVHLTHGSGDSASPKAYDAADELPAMSGRGTTRAVGKERMTELRNLFAATAAK